MAGASYNITRFTRQVLKRHRKEPPSLVLHLYPTHFRFEQQHGNFNYDSPMKCFLEAIREQKLPTDLLDVLDEAGIRYYEGCLIVEVHDHRAAPAPVTTARPSFGQAFQLGRTPQAPQASKAEVYRIVLGPNPATLWTELGIMERRMLEESEKEEGAEPAVGWTEEEAVEIEAVILARTAPPICLSPSIQTSRIANSMLRATTLRPPKRKRFCGSGEGDEDEVGEEGQRREREEHERMMKLGDEGVGRGRGHAFARLAFIQSYRDRTNNPTPSTSQPSGITSIRITAPQPSGTSTAAGSPASTQQQPPRKKKNASVAPESQVGTPVDSGAAAMAAAAGSKKAKKLAAQALADANDPSLPLDPVAREAELEKRKKAALVKKRADAKIRKEKKAAAAAAAQAQNDLQVGGSPAPQSLKIALPQAKFNWPQQ